ncbi:MAG: 5-bromo-4-chloroindolyl phosphate hydrolysis family protein [Clostridia bacterium]|nr:5-bromo-4-chloroindolyl phosphate hydrolysis family protein [Clostridia bacterium]
MKKVHVKSAIPIYFAAGVWLLAGLLLPRFLLKLPGLLVTIVLSVGAYYIGTRLFPGRDVEVQEKVSTGDAAVDREIEIARERLENLRRANEAIPDAEITGQLDRMVNAGQQIFKELGRDPRKIALVRRFMNYYLPTSEKLMEQYQVLMNASTKGENITSAMQTIESSLGLAANAFEKCADNMYRDDEMDIDAEIKVMQTMLTGDNLIATGVSAIHTDRETPNETSAAVDAAEGSGETEKTTKEGIRLTLGGH